MKLASLSEGARQSANRAGLVVCGGVAPAVAALRAGDDRAGALRREERCLMLRLVKLAAVGGWVKVSCTMFTYSRVGQSSRSPTRGRPSGLR